MENGVYRISAIKGIKVEGADAIGVEFATSFYHGGKVCDAWLCVAGAKPIPLNEQQKAVLAKSGLDAVQSVIVV